MAGKAGPLHEHEAIRDVVARLLAATESIASRDDEPAEPSRPVPAVFLFTSVRRGQGTSTVAAAVSRAMAEAGIRTVLAVVGRAGRDSEPSGVLSLEEAVDAASPAAFGEPPLLTLRIPSRYTDLPENARNPGAWLNGRFEVLIVDSPEMTSSLTRYWMPMVHGVVLVVDGEKVAVRTMVQAREDVVRLGGRLVGVVLNRYRSRIPRFLAPYVTYG